MLNGIAAKSFATATAVESATQIIHELLQFTVQGITCYQSRVAPTIAEACGALLAGGHCDALHRDFTISIAFVLCLFYKASGVAASCEAKNTGKPYSPKQLAKVFEATLYEVFTDPRDISSRVLGLTLQRPKRGSQLAPSLPKSSGRLRPWLSSPSTSQIVCASSSSRTPSRTGSETGTPRLNLRQSKRIYQVTSSFKTS